MSMSLAQIEAEIVVFERHLSVLRGKREDARRAIMPKMAIHPLLRVSKTLDEALKYQAQANPGAGIHWKDMAKAITWYKPISIYNRMFESARIVRAVPECECTSEAAPWSKPANVGDGMFYSRF